MLVGSSLLQGLFCSCGEWGLLFITGQVHRPLTVVASCCGAQVLEHAGLVCSSRAVGCNARGQQLWHVDSVVVAHMFSCSSVCGVFSDQG